MSSSGDPGDPGDPGDLGDPGDPPPLGIPNGGLELWGLPPKGGLPPKAAKALLYKAKDAAEV